MNHLFTDKIQSNKKEFIELTEEVLQTNLLLIDEVHGVKENVFLYYSLFNLFEFDTIVLRYPNSMQEPIINFLSTGIFPIHTATESISDGNINKTYLLFLKQLYSEGVLKKLIFIDPDTQDFNHWNDKEKASFDLFKNNFSDANKALIILGSPHSETQTFSVDSKTSFDSGSLIPFAYHLRNHFKDVPICKLFYHSGKYFNFNVKEFPKTHNPEHMLRKRKTEDRKYEIHFDNVTPVDTF